MAKSPEFEKAQIEKMQAEAAAALAEANSAKADAAKQAVYLEEAKISQRLAEMRLAEAEEKEAARTASDYHNRTYRLLGSVGGASAKAAIDVLTEWSRIDPGCAIEFIIDSPGGEIIAGFHLYDVMRDLSDKGHHITTRALGMAASMGGVLLQAGDTRIMAPRASMLIHEAQFGAGGSFGQVEDTVAFIKQLQDRILAIFAERSKLSKVQIKNRWKRKNWWLDADEALKHGFVDEVR